MRGAGDWRGRMRIVTMTVDVVDKLLEEVEDALALVGPGLARKKLMGLRMSLMSLRDEAKGAD